MQTIRFRATPLVQIQARRKANFCLATGISPAQYERLTLAEIQAFREAVESSNGK